jgi:hypothetical protein
MATSTFEPIATYTLPSAANNYTFSSIPSTYTHLYLVANILSTGTGLDYYIIFNGDNSANYATTKCGTTAATNNRASNRVNAARAMQLFYTTSGSLSGSWTAGEVWIPYYTSTVFTKNIQAQGGGNPEVGFSSSFWNNTDAITSLGVAATQVFGGGDTLGAGTTLTLYGIKKE